MSQLSSEGFKAVICFFSTASSLSSDFLPVLSNFFLKKEEYSQKELMGKCLYRELNDGVV